MTYSPEIAKNVISTGMGGFPACPVRDNVESKKFSNVDILYTVGKEISC